MKYYIAFAFVMLSIGSDLRAQELEFSINTDYNFTLLPEFTNNVLIIEEFILPGFIHPSNAVNPINYSQKTSPSIRSGYGFGIELGIKFSDKIKLIIIGGINLSKYHYETNINIEGTEPVNLKDLVSDYGNPKFLYANLKPLNVSTAILNDKLNVTIGPSINFLLIGKYYNVIAVYKPLTEDNGLEEEVDIAYYEEVGDFQKVLFGMNLRIGYQVLTQLDIYMSSQYYFDPILKSINPGEVLRPTYIQFGCSFNLTRK